MKILIRKSDNIVIHAQNDLVLLQDRLEFTNGQDFNFNDSNSTIIEVDEIPEFFSGGIFSYENGAFTVVDTVRYDANNEEALVEAKDNKIALIKSTTITTNSVLVGGVYYNGGAESASLIKSAIDLMQLKDLQELGVWDENDVVTVMSLADAMDIVISIADECATIMYQRQARIAAVKLIEIDPQGQYTTYEEAIAALDLI
jgi:hypothetical protein